MADDASFLDALVHYRTLFPDKASLGAGTPPAAWYSELSAVAGDAFDAITGTAVNLESGSASGVLNFRQVHKVRALHARRAELDSEYSNPYLLPVTEPLPPRRLGFVVRMGL